MTDLTLYDVKAHARQAARRIILSAGEKRQRWEYMFQILGGIAYVVQNDEHMRAYITRFEGQTVVSSATLCTELPPPDMPTLLKIYRPDGVIIARLMIGFDGVQDNTNPLVPPETLIRLNGRGAFDDAELDRVFMHVRSAMMYDNVPVVSDYTPEILAAG